MDIRNQTLNLVIIYGIVGVLIGITFIIRILMNTNTPFQSKIPGLYFKLFGIFNFWCISHLVMYILLGFFAPSLWYISLALSILWESFEYVIEKKFRFIKYRTLDFFTNIIGLIIGITIYDLVNYIKTKNKNKKKNLKVPKNKDEDKDKDEDKETQISININ